MSLQKDARVTVGVEGADEVARAADRALTPWQSAAQRVGGAFRAVGGAVAESVQGIVSDIGHVVTAAGAISFAGAIQQVHAFEETVARIGVGAGRSIESVQAGFNELGQGIGEMPSEVAAWSSSVARLTHSFEGASQAAKGMKEYAALTGETFQQVEPLAVALQTVGGVAGDTSHAIGMIAAQAQQLGTIGGPQAIGEAFVRLQGQISLLSNSEDVSKVTALLGGFGGKGLTAPQRERSLGAVMSRVEANPEGFERFLGHKITDEFGHIKDMAGVLRELGQYGKKGKGEQKRLQFTFGAEAAAALVNTDYDAIRKAEQVAPSTAPAHALERLEDTPAGKRKADEIKKATAMQGLVGSQSVLGGLSDSFGHFAAEHPIGAMISAQLGTRLLGQGAKGLLGLFQGGGGAAGTGTTVAAEGVGATGVSAAGASAEVVPTLTTGLGGAALAPLAAIAGIVAFTGAALVDLFGTAHHQMGFENRAIGADEAKKLGDKARAANEAAAGNRSPGMQAALEAEQARIAREHARQSQAALAPPPAPPAAPGDALYKTTVDQLVKAGASLALAQETAAALLKDQRTPVQITVINATGGAVDAQVRGDQ